MLVMLYLAIRDFKTFLLKKLTRAGRPHKTLAIKPREREMFEMPLEQAKDDMMIVEDYEEEKSE